MTGGSGAKSGGDPSRPGPRTGTQGPIILEYRLEVLSDEVIPEPAGLLGAIDNLDRQRVCLLA
jgi:hypothetical protein